MVRCSSGHRVPAGSRFCPRCGVAVGPEGCSSCGAPLAADARFCVSCGARVVVADRGLTPAAVREPGSSTQPPVEPPAPVEPVEELRQLTAVFCDMVGSTELSTRLDPEEFREVIGRYQARVRTQLDRFGGSVAKYLGDGILIHFGWPIAHDDDAERAILSALAIVEDFASATADPALTVRVGIHTGPVVVGDVDQEGYRDTIALGETMNRAARLQGEAPPGGVVISDSTLALVQGVFVVEDLGERALAGITDPVCAHRVLGRSGALSRLDATPERLTPFVSRADELECLVELSERAGAGSGQAVLLRGEPGVGKSRLVYELRHRLAGAGHRWLETRASSYSQRSAFQPAVELVEQAVDVLQTGDTDEDEDAHFARLETAFRMGGVTEPDAIALMAELIGIGTGGAPDVVMGPDLARRRTIEVLCRATLALSERTPLVVIIEDLHWCDESTLDVIEQMVVQVPSTHLLLIVTARPELETDWLEHPNLHTVDVQPFSDGEVRELLQRLSPGLDLPEEVLAKVVEEADGVPLFAEEVGRMVLESSMLVESAGALELAAPIDQLEIPTTLHDSLMARLDRLSAAKQVAQFASAIGREFDHRLLERVSGLPAPVLDYGLQRLLEDELVFQSGVPPDAVYTFKHSLIQDTAYRSLLKRSRRALHHKIAEALAERSDAGGASAEILGRHWEAAGNPREAIVHYMRASEQAARRAGHGEAVAHLTRAVELAAELSDDVADLELEVELQMELGSLAMALRGFADPDVERAYERAHELCDRIGRSSQVGYALIGLAIFHFNNGRVAEGADLATSALEIAEREDDDALRILAGVQLAVPRYWQGRFQEAAAHADAAYALYDRDRHAWLASRSGVDQGVAALCLSASARVNGGRPDQGLARIHEAVELARTTGSPFNVVYALAFEGGVRWDRMELGEMEELGHEVVAISEEHGFSDFAGLGRVIRGAGATGRQDPGALADALEGVALAASTGRRGGVPGFLESVAAAQTVHGATEEALAVVDGALELAEETGQHYWDPKLRRLRGELLLTRDPDSPAPALEELHRAIELAREQGNVIAELRAATVLARHLGGGDGTENAVEAWIRPAYERLEEGWDIAPATAAAALLGAALGGSGAQSPDDQAVSNPSSG